MQIDSSTILVTGGSSGLGAACVEDARRRGASVIIADLAPPRGDSAKDIADRVLVCPDRCDKRSRHACRDFGGRGAIRAAARRRRLRGSTARRTNRRTWGRRIARRFRRVIEINLNGTFNVVRLAAEAIAKSKPQEDGLRGVVVMTSSVSAFEGQIGQASYAASKGGVASLTLPLARELGQHGIRVVSIAPGVFETPMMQAAHRKSAPIAGRTDSVPEAIWAIRKSSLRSSATSLKTTCSTAACCGWTVRFAWGRRKQLNYILLFAARGTNWSSLARSPCKQASAWRSESAIASRAAASCDRSFADNSVSQRLRAQAAAKSSIASHDNSLLHELPFEDFLAVADEHVLDGNAEDDE